MSIILISSVANPESEVKSRGTVQCRLTSGSEQAADFGTIFFLLKYVFISVCYPTFIKLLHFIIHIKCVVCILFVVFFNVVLFE